ncbi:very short patch repair endonuclease [Actinoplanes sp. NPDC049118]|uniref:very short patch repair endonuclease n=1 Tax=Actinoplanes sp. NPDC049118 TaxID=3155769 RepID=UPI0033F6E998
MWPQGRGRRIVDPVQTPVSTSEAVSRSMKANRRTGTGPERRVRSVLHRLGLRFRKDYLVTVAGVRVRVDIAFPRRRVAVFVDGCFWHSCNRHGSLPKTNVLFWQQKLRKNVERDALVTQALSAAGWQVVRIWEHEEVGAAASQVASVVGGRGPL